MPAIPPCAVCSIMLCSAKVRPAILALTMTLCFAFYRWRENLRIRGTQEIKTVPYAPTSHPFTERLVGTIRREYLDQILFWNERDLEEKLDELKNYYNIHRVHQALSGKRQMKPQAGIHPTMLNLVIFRGCHIVMGCFRRRLPLDSEFAMHTSAQNVHVKTQAKLTI